MNFLVLLNIKKRHIHHLNFKGICNNQSLKFGWQNGWAARLARMTGLSRPEQHCLFRQTGPKKI